MLDRLYKFIQTVSNNELNGNISPQEFKLLLHSCVNERYEENIYELNKIINRERRGLMNNFSLDNITGKIRERILHYYIEQDAETTLEGRFDLPDDLRYLDTVEVDSYEAELTNNRRHFLSLISFQDTKPTTLLPIYYKMNGIVQVAPPSRNAKILIHYLRNPKVANWTYVLVPNPRDASVFVEIYNPTSPDFQDVDIHPSEEYYISIKMLKRLGINLKEEQITQYGLANESLDSQQENSN